MRAVNNCIHSCNCPSVLSVAAAAAAADVDDADGGKVMNGPV